MRRTVAVAAASLAILLGAASVQAGDRTTIQARTGTTTTGQGCITGGTPIGPALGTSTLAWNGNVRQQKLSISIALKGAQPNTTYSLQLAEYTTDSQACWFGNAGEPMTDGNGDLRHRLSLSGRVQGQYRVEVWLVPPSGDPLFAGGIDTP